MDSRNIYTPDEFTKARHKELVMSLSEAELTAGCSPLKAIREKCIECAGGRAESLAKCNMINCPLWDYRFGTNPYKEERVITPEEREEIRRRLFNN